MTTDNKVRAVSVEVRLKLSDGQTLEIELDDLDQAETTLMMNKDIIDDLDRGDMIRRYRHSGRGHIALTASGRWKE